MIKYINIITKYWINLHLFNPSRASRAQKGFCGVVKSLVTGEDRDYVSWHPVADSREVSGLDEE